MIVDWPVLSDDEIERLASDFRSQALGSLALNRGGAVPVEQIAEQYLGYDLEFVDDNGALPGDVIGGIDFDTDTIIINSAIERVTWVDIASPLPMRLHTMCSTGSFF